MSCLANTPGPLAAQVCPLQTLVSILVDGSPVIIAEIDVECCQAPVPTEITWNFTNDSAFQIAINPAAIVFVNNCNAVIPCIDDSFSGQLVLSNYTIGLINPGQGYAIKAIYTPNSNCSEGTFNTFIRVFPMVNGPTIDDYCCFFDNPLIINAIRNCPAEYDPAICMSCDFVDINGGPSLDCGQVGCANIGDTININLNVGFPARTFAIISASSILDRFLVVGDFTALFSIGTIFTVASSTCNDGTYTVLNSSFDGTNTYIYTTTPVPCASGDGIIQDIQVCQPDPTDPCLPCNPTLCNGVVSVLVVNNSTGAVVFTQTLPAINNVVSSLLSVLIADFGSYHITVTASDCLGLRVCEWNVEACYNYSIVKKECHLYTFTDSQTTPVKINTITVTNYDNTYQVVYTVDTSSIFSLDILFPSDDIYTLTITNNLNNDIRQFVVYDFCDLIKCYRKLFLTIYCNEVDPCCNNCDTATIEALKKKRYELEKMLALGTSLFAYVLKDRIDTLGQFGLLTDEHTSIDEVYAVFSKLKEVVNRCGECNTPVVQSTPCKSC